MRKELNPMEIKTADFKRFLLDTYRDLPDDIDIIDDRHYHILSDKNLLPFLIYSYDERLTEYSYVCLHDIEWKTIILDKVA